MSKSANLGWAALFTTVAAVGAYISYKRYWAKKKKVHVIFVIGGPGSGKGTQCTLITQKYGYTHLSAGDLLRAERASGSELADMINRIMLEGKIVPSEVTTGLLLKAMKQDGNSKFLIDGFPRNTENRTSWEELAGADTELQFMLLLDCPQEIMLSRLLERSKTSGRVDDNHETILKRLKSDSVAAAPVIEHFKSIGKLRVVNSNMPIQEVFDNISIHIDNSANWDGN
jgi:UMP-CMP kinase